MAITARHAQSRRLSSVSGRRRVPCDDTDDVDDAAGVSTSRRSLIGFQIAGIGQCRIKDLSGTDAGDRRERSKVFSGPAILFGPPFATGGDLDDSFRSVLPAPNRARHVPTCAHQLTSPTRLSAHIEYRPLSPASVLPGIRSLGACHGSLGHSPQTLELMRERPHQLARGTLQPGLTTTSVWNERRRERATQCPTRALCRARSVTYCDPPRERGVEVIEERLSVPMNGDFPLIRLT